jgi:RNA-splicing ligase RtcB
MDLERIDENRWRDVADVVQVVCRAALARRVAQLRPLVVIEG